MFEGGESMSLLKRKKDFVIPETGLDSVEKVVLGGVEQTVLFQAVDPTKPILLFVHGGPAMPVPGVVSRGQDYAVAIATKELVQHFVVVFWDQRGAGKSYHHSIPSESMRVEQYISDCKELIDYLRTRFDKQKIYLAGHSWGTIIGLSIANRFPNTLHAYVGISQIINWAENDRFCYDWLKAEAEKVNDKKTLKKLKEMGTPPFLKIKQWMEFRKPLMKYKSMIYESETVKHPGMKAAFNIFWSSSEYSIIDIFNTFSKAYKLTYTQSLIDDFAQIDFYPINRIEIPVYFLHGKHDVHLSGQPVKVFVENLEAPQGKKLIWYEKSSHMFHPDDARAIETFFIEQFNPL
jgi:pimeloyl-ACP methyl ester carboxylesterase